MSNNPTNHDECLSREMRRITREMRERRSKSKPDETKTFKAGELKERAKWYLFKVYGNPGEGNDYQRWMDRYDMICAFIDDQFYDDWDEVHGEDHNAKD